METVCAICISKGNFGGGQYVLAQGLAIQQVVISCVTADDCLYKVLSRNNAQKTSIINMFSLE